MTEIVFSRYSIIGRVIKVLIYRQTENKNGSSNRAPVFSFIILCTDSCRQEYLTVKLESGFYSKGILFLFSSSHISKDLSSGFNFFEKPRSRAFSKSSPNSW